MIWVKCDSESCEILLVNQQLDFVRSGTSARPISPAFIFYDLENANEIILDNPEGMLTCDWWLA